MERKRMRREWVGNVRKVLQTSRLMSGVKKVISTLVVDLQIRDVSGEYCAW